MVDVTHEFLDEVYKTVRHVKLKGTLTSYNGSVVRELTDEDFVSDVLTKVSKAVGGTSFRLGDVHIDYVKFSLGYSDKVPQDLINYTVELYYGLELPDGSDEWCKIGTYFINHTGVVRRTKYMEITADSMLCMTDDDVFDSTSGSPYDIASWVCSSCGLTLATTEDDFNSYLRNSNLSISLPSPGTNSSIKTYRDVLMWLAHLTCSFVTCDVDGNVVFKNFLEKNVERDLEINPNTVVNKEFANYEFILNGVSMNIDGTYYGANDGIKDETLALEENPFMLSISEDEDRTIALLDIVADLKNIRYIPYKIEFNGNPAIEVGDYVVYNDMRLLVTSYTFKYRGKSVIQGVGLPFGNNMKQSSSTRGTSVSGGGSSGGSGGDGSGGGDSGGGGTGGGGSGLGDIVDDLDDTSVVKSSLEDSFEVQGYHMNPVGKTNDDTNGLNASMVSGSSAFSYGELGGYYNFNNAYLFKELYLGKFDKDKVSTNPELILNIGTTITVQPSALAFTSSDKGEEKLDKTPPVVFDSVFYEAKQAVGSIFNAGMTVSVLACLYIGGKPVLACAKVIDRYDTGSPQYFYIDSGKVPHEELDASAFFGSNTSLNTQINRYTEMRDTLIPEGYLGGSFYDLRDEFDGKNMYLRFYYDIKIPPRVLSVIEYKYKALSVETGAEYERRSYSLKDTRSDKDIYPNDNYLQYDAYPENRSTSHILTSTFDMGKLNSETLYATSLFDTAIGYDFDIDYKLYYLPVADGDKDTEEDKVSDIINSKATKEDLSSITADITELKADIIELSNDLARLNKRVDDLSDDIGDINDDIADVNARIDITNESINNLAQTVANHSVSITTHDDELASLKSRILELERLLNVVETKITDFYIKEGYYAFKDDTGMYYVPHNYNFMLQVDVENADNCQCRFKQRTSLTGEYTTFVDYSTERETLTSISSYNKTYYYNVDILAGSTSLTADSDIVIHTYRCLSTSISSSVTGKQIHNTKTTLTASGSYGLPAVDADKYSLQYKFIRRVGSTTAEDEVLQDWGSSNTCEYTLDYADTGNSTVYLYAYVTDGFEEVLSSYKSASVGALAASISTSSSTTVGVPVTYTATAKYGGGEYEYKFTLSSNSNTSGEIAILQDWSTSNTFEYTPDEVTNGKVYILTYVRDQFGVVVTYYSSLTVS